MSRNIKIKEATSHRFFQDYDKTAQTDGRPIKCAFELSRNCSPDCAACDIDSSICSRGDFQIGFIVQ